MSSSKSLLSASTKFLSTSRVHDLTSWRIDRSVESLALRQKFHFPRKTNIWNQSTRRSLILSPVSYVSYSPLVKINSYLRLADTLRYGFVNINSLVLFGGFLWGGLLTQRMMKLPDDFVWMFPRKSWFGSFCFDFNTQSCSGEGEQETLISEVGHISLLCYTFSLSHWQRWRKQWSRSTIYAGKHLLGFESHPPELALYLKCHTIQGIMPHNRVK